MVLKVLAPEWTIGTTISTDPFAGNSGMAGMPCPKVAPPAALL